MIYGLGPLVQGVGHDFRGQVRTFVGPAEAFQGAGVRLRGQPFGDAAFIEDHRHPVMDLSCEVIGLGGDDDKAELLGRPVEGKQSGQRKQAGRTIFQ